jgi:Zinc finger, ZZ type
MTMDEENSDDPFVCNGCMCDLLDFRYKCLSCPDFDLCDEVNKSSFLKRFILFLKCRFYN